MKTELIRSVRPVFLPQLPSAAISPPVSKLVNCSRKATYGTMPSLVVVENHAQKQTADFEAGVAVVDKADLSEVVHKVADPRSSRAHHFCQGFLLSLTFPF
jgi:hypothetical protein